jgi:hypothetical protein
VVALLVALVGSLGERQTAWSVNDGGERKLMVLAWLWCGRWLWCESRKSWGASVKYLYLGEENGGLSLLCLRYWPERMNAQEGGRPGGRESGKVQKASVRFAQVGIWNCKCPYLP